MSRAFGLGRLIALVIVSVAVVGWIGYGRFQAERAERVELSAKSQRTAQAAAEVAAKKALAAAEAAAKKAQDEAKESATLVRCRDQKAAAMAEVNAALASRDFDGAYSAAHTCWSAAGGDDWERLRDQTVALGDLEALKKVPKTDWFKRLELLRRIAKLDPSAIGPHAAELQALERRQVEVEAATPKGDWQSQSMPDGMGRGLIKYAYVQSSNTVEFRFPYTGPQHATLALRVHPRKGRDVMLEIEKGQLMCPSYDGCSVLVRFDDGPALRFSAAGPADHSSTRIFIDSFDRFVSQLRRSKTVRIEALVYQEGAPRFEFSVEGLGTWPGKGE